MRAFLSVNFVNCRDFWETMSILKATNRLNHFRILGVQVVCLLSLQPLLLCL